MIATLAEELLMPAESAAQRLLGSWLIREVEGQTLVARIVETEAYDQTDAASHSYRPQTERTKVMFGPAGYLYVYFTYGMHYCCNVVSGAIGEGSAVLLRAVEPLRGELVMTQNRHGRARRQLTNGPAKVCQALSINKALNGHNLMLPPLTLRLQPALSRDEIIQTTRIGISKERNRRWRFYIKANPYVSRSI